MRKVGERIVSDLTLWDTNETKKFTPQRPNLIIFNINHNYEKVFTRTVVPKGIWSFNVIKG